jgi:hypothetical protein
MRKYLSSTPGICERISIQRWHSRGRSATGPGPAEGQNSGIIRDPAWRYGGLRQRQLGVGGLHLGEGSRDVGGEGRGLAGRYVNMQRHVLGGGRHPALGGVKQLLEEMQPLGVVVEELKGHPHRVARMQLAQVAHVHLGGEAGLPACLHIIGAAAQKLERLVHRPIEQNVVVGHVEMAVIVDPRRLDPHHRGDEGGKEYRFVVEAIEHPPVPRQLPIPPEVV